MLIQAKVRLTIQRFGKTEKPTLPSERLTIRSVMQSILANSAASFGN
nr:MULTISPECIES: hypothetical protein [Acidiphilium]